MKRRVAIAKRMVRPRFETLEDKALLSSLAATLTTNMAVYQPGQAINITFTETNTGTSPVQVTFGPVNDGFNVTQNGNAVWQSNAGANPMYLRLDTLQPGQSIVLNETWNGVPNQTNSTTEAAGTFTVTNQLNSSGASATFQIASPASDPISSPPPVTIPPPPSNPISSPPPVTITSPPSYPISSPPPAASAPAVTATLATGGSTYRVGHRVLLTLTLTNSGSQPVAIDPPNTAVFTLSRGSTVVWSSTGKKQATRAVQSLAPGQSIEIHGVWMGKPLHGALKTLIKPGVYQLEGSAGGYTASTTIRLTGRSIH